MAYGKYGVFVRCVLGLGLLAAGVAAADEPGFEPLFDGKSLAGWKASENVDSWKVADGQIVCHGPRSHLFYVGPDADHPAEFKD
ncbi:MAG: family 16 glycoside hydrolase, partial [Planctomycetia bacterium]